MGEDEKETSCRNLLPLIINHLLLPRANIRMYLLKILQKHLIHVHDIDGKIKLIIYKHIRTHQTNPVSLRLFEFIFLP